MNELTVIQNDDGLKVDGRQLHMFLEVGARYNDWFSRMCEYGFEEGKDFYSNLSKTPEQGGRPQTNHLLTISMAKEIAMLQRNAKGKQARQYFLKVEEEWNTPEKVIARGYEYCKKMLEITKYELKEANDRIEADKPKVLFANAVSASKTSILIGELAKLLKQNGFDIGQNRLFKWLREHKYLMAGNEPTQRAMDLKLFEVKERTINSPDGSIRITRTTKVTGKGQQYFINKFLTAAVCRGVEVGGEYESNN